MREILVACAAVRSNPGPAFLDDWYAPDLKRQDYNADELDRHLLGAENTGAGGADRKLESGVRPSLTAEPVE